MSTLNYLFTSERLGFRNWRSEDLGTMSTINADPAVMEFFPALQSENQSLEFIERMQNHFAKKGFCYFAVDELSSSECIGFIGLMEKDFESEFTPCIDIGWRLKQTHWNKGYASEGAKRCLVYAFNELNLHTIVSMAPRVNVKSEQVMIKIGMQKVKDFKHPLLKGDQRLEDCVLYQIHKN